ncbi:MAG TPA: pirin family protein [Gemmataceae bacterium]|nr:pirin family protein [Gemmataceae bacterium]
MLQIRKAHERGHFNHGWLDTYHTFSFADYHDPAHMGFRSLRVINEDRVAAGQGFGMHGHRDMEIVTLVLQGALEHRDSLGNGEVLRPGELQRMSAGTGIRHSEFNPSAMEPVHLYQIWLLPDTKNLTPTYEQKAFAAEEQRDRLRLVAGPGGRDGALTIHQDAEIYLGTLSAGAQVTHPLRKGRGAWLQVIRGDVLVNGVKAQASDGVAIEDEADVRIEAVGAADIMLFDLA